MTITRKIIYYKIRARALRHALKTPNTHRCTGYTTMLRLLHHPLVKRFRRLAFVVGIEDLEHSLKVG
jgi:hypothetical protein